MTTQEIQKCWAVDEDYFGYDSLSELIKEATWLVAGRTIWVGDVVRPEPKYLCNARDVLEIVEVLKFKQRRKIPFIQ